MSHPPAYEIDALPLWAQVLMASRMTRRAVYGLPEKVPESAREALASGCDAIDRSAERGSWTTADRAIISHAKNLMLSGHAHKTLLAMFYAADATFAATDAMDFSAADAACASSARKSISFASQSGGMNLLQASMAIAGDLDTIGFACAEAGIGRHDALGEAVMLRLAPVYAPAV